MTLTQTDAATALREIDAAQLQSRQLFSYSKASPHLLLWGSIWIATGVMLAINPASVKWIWTVANSIGFATSLYIAFAGSRATPNSDAQTTSWGTRYMFLIIIALGFFFAVRAIFGPITGVQAMSLSALMLSTIYMGVGLWAGTRYIVVGAILAALTMVGFFLVPDHAVSFISCAGGAALAMGGFWMRRA